MFLGGDVKIMVDRTLSSHPSPTYAKFGYGASFG